MAARPRSLGWGRGSHPNDIEVADHGRRVMVRDTNDRTGAVPRFNTAAWRRFAD